MKLFSIVLDTFETFVIGSLPFFALFLVACLQDALGIESSKFTAPVTVFLSGLIGGLFIRMAFGRKMKENVDDH